MGKELDFATCKAKEKGRERRAPTATAEKERTEPKKKCGKGNWMDGLGESRRDCCFEKLKESDWRKFGKKNGN